MFRDTFLVKFHFLIVDSFFTVLLEKVLFSGEFLDITTIFLIINIQWSMLVEMCAKKTLSLSNTLKMKIEG